MRHRFWSLLLVTLWLTACSNDAKPTYPQRRAGRGEPCLVLNDCKEPLFCLGMRCLDAKPPVLANNNQCVVGSCLNDEDCCLPLTSFAAERCEQLDRSCNSGSSRSCDQHSAECVCTSTCKNYQCSADARNQCTTDLECGLGRVCYEGHCADCAFDVNCDDGQICQNEHCQLACKHDGHCGALETCDPNGHCAPRGCLSDLECISLLGVRDALCKNDECIVPCANDAVCASAAKLSTCNDGVCRDLGCEQDADCEARLHVPDRSIALCLPADEASAVRDSTTNELFE